MLYFCLFFIAEQQQLKQKEHGAIPIHMPLNPESVWGRWRGDLYMLGVKVRNTGLGRRCTKLQRKVTPAMKSKLLKAFLLN